MPPPKPGSVPPNPITVHVPLRLVDLEALIKSHVDQERRRLAHKVRAVVGQLPLLWRGQAKTIVYGLADSIEGRD